MNPVLEAVWMVLRQKYGGIKVGPQLWYYDHTGKKLADGCTVWLSHLVEVTVADNNGQILVMVEKTWIVQDLVLEDPDMLDGLLRSIDALADFTSELAALQLERPRRALTVTKAIREFQDARDLALDICDCEACLGGQQ